MVTVIEAIRRIDKAHNKENEFKEKDNESVLERLSRLIKPCDLCDLEKKSKWFYTDEDVIVCECIVCRIPQIVLRKHTMTIDFKMEQHMQWALTEVAKNFYKTEDFYIDKQQRNITDHMHWHARPVKW